MNRRLIYVLSICGIIILLTMLPVRIPERVNSTTEVNDVWVSQTTHAPFNITHNSNFSDLGFPGSGTEEDPYIIDDILIEYDGVCIYIANTTAYFEIRNSVFDGQNTGEGVWLRNVTHGTILNCTLIDCYEGIYVQTTNFTAIDGCTFQNNTYGISAYSLDSCTISDNEMNGSVRGMLFGHCLNSLIVSNEIRNSRFYGIVLYLTGRNCTVRDNIVSGVEDPDVINGGALVLGFGAQNWSIISNRMENSNPCVRLESSGGGNLFYDNYMQSSGTVIQTSWKVAGITFDSNTIVGGYTGIYLSNSEELTLGNNEFRSIKIRDIYLSDTAACVIENNSLLKGIIVQGFSPSSWNHDVSGNTLPTGDLVYLLGVDNQEVDTSDVAQLIIAHCDNLTISGANIHDVARGVQIGYASDCLISDSTIANNSLGGFYLADTEDIIIDGCRIEGNGIESYTFHGGIYLGATKGTNITRNIIYNNSGNGIETIIDERTLIYNNWISHNEVYGINLHGSDSLVYGNAIGWNEIGNARDDGENNQWDDGEEMGNWWNDYSDTEHYDIPGGAGSVDRYPMLLTENSRKIPIADTDQNIMIIIIASAGVLAVAAVLLIVMRKRGMI